MVINEYINKIVEIGKKGSCTFSDLEYFMNKGLPSVGNTELRETLRRIYKVDMSHITRWEFLSLDPASPKQKLSAEKENFVSFVVNLIKGCHLIEVKSGGFGSTTNVFNLFGSIINIDVHRAIDLYNWVAFNGGNYYIEKNISHEDARRMEVVIAESQRKERMRINKIHTDAVARRQKNRNLHAKRFIKKQEMYKGYREKFIKMSDKQLIEAFNREVGNTGWTSTRAIYLSALSNEFKNRDFNYSVVKRKGGLSFKNKIKLVGKNIELVKIVDKAKRSDGLNKNYTLESFKVNSNNELAYTVALALSKKPGKLYNPYYIWGDRSSLPEITHLVHAIGNKIVQENKNSRVVYYSAVELLDQLVESIKAGTLEKFKRKLADSKLVIIEDIEYISGKEKTQEIILSIFNDLLNKNNQIIITSSVPPKSTPLLSEHLQALFLGGITVEIYK